MGRFKRENIYGYCLDESIVCEDCLTDEEDANLKEDQLITQTDEDELVFCDRCGKRISGN